MSFHVPDLTPHENNIVASTKPEAAFERLADQNQSKKDNLSRFTSMQCRNLDVRG